LEIRKLYSFLLGSKQVSENEITEAIFVKRELVLDVHMDKGSRMLLNFVIPSVMPLNVNTIMKPIFMAKRSVMVCLFTEVGMC
jgi:hypothetical protein